jgi:hypothetical protein
MTTEPVWSASVRSRSGEPFLAYRRTIFDDAGA